MAENKERQINTPDGEIKSNSMIDVGVENNAVLPREVKSWMEKVEGLTPSVQQGVIDDSTGQTVLSPTAPVNPVIVMPITKRTFVAGFKKTVTDAGKWLSTFIFRFIKIKKGQVKFQE